MPDKDGNIKGISVPRVPWHKDGKPEPRKKHRDDQICNCKQPCSEGEAFLRDWLKRDYR